VITKYQDLGLLGFFLAFFVRIAQLVGCLWVTLALVSKRAPPVGGGPPHPFQAKICLLLPITAFQARVGGATLW